MSSCTEPLFDFRDRDTLAAVDRLVARQQLSQAQATRLRKAITEAAPPRESPAPPASAEEQLIALTEAHMAAHHCTFAEASGIVQKAHRDLAEQRLWETRHPGQPYRPVAKAAPPTYEAVLKLVDLRRASQPQVSRDEAFCQVLADHDGTPHYGEVYEMYRRYQQSDGIRDRDAAILAQYSGKGA